MPHAPVDPISIYDYNRVDTCNLMLA
jgi:hypothetical protein